MIVNMYLDFCHYVFQYNFKFPVVRSYPMDLFITKPVTLDIHYRVHFTNHSDIFVLDEPCLCGNVFQLFFSPTIYQRMQMG
jgi:hypothetical protein